MAMAVVKGGEMSGSSVAASSDREPAGAPSPARAAVKAKRKPERRAARAHQRRQEQAVGEGLAVVGVAEDGPDVAQREAAALEEGEPATGAPAGRGRRAPSSAQRTRTVSARTSAGRARSRRHGLAGHSFAFRTSLIQRSTMRLRLAPGVGVVDGEDLGALEHLGQARLDLHLGVRRHEVDLVLGEEATAWPALVAQSISFLPSSGFLAPLSSAMASAEVPMPSCGKLMTTS